MKKLFMITTSLCLFASTYAQDAEQFSKHKTEMLGNIDQRITHMQENRACVAAATDKDALKKCHEANKAFREEMVSTHQSKRMEHMEKRSKSLEERKAKLAEKMKK